MEIQALIIKAKNGDSEAFGLIYDTFAARIFKYIKIKIQNQQEAEDILQEVFVKAYKGLATLNMGKLNFNAWLYKVAGNTINDYFRKKYRSPQISGMDENFDAPANYSVEKDFAVKWDYGQARVAFEQLPPLYRQVLELRFIQELSLNEVADILNKNNLSIRLIQHRALKKVRLILNNHHDLGYQKI